MNVETDFLPTATIETLKMRADLLKRIRSFFDSRLFWEVETPLLSRDVVVDLHIEPIELQADEISPNLDKSYWLQTSPEFAMKRLLVAGAKRIYQICKAFRQSERGRHHNPEFTMLEWYQVGDSYDEGRALLGEFAKALFGTQDYAQTSYAQLFKDAFGLNPHICEIELLQKAVSQRTSYSGPIESDRDELLNILLSDVIEPTLGQDSPQIVFDFPATQSALAQIRDESVPVAERYELYYRGTEIANGYHELLDADELKQRNNRVNQQRIAAGKRELPSDSRLLAAMQSGMPSCCGVAVGVDRLLMLLCGADSIDDVLAFPLERA